MKGKIPNLPAAGQTVVFRPNKQAYKDLVMLRELLAVVVDDDKPLSISETIRLCIRFTAARRADFVQAPVCQTLHTGQYLKRLPGNRLVINREATNE